MSECVSVCENEQGCERVCVFGFECEWVFGCRCEMSDCQCVDVCEGVEVIWV